MGRLIAAHRGGRVALALGVILTLPGFPMKRTGPAEEPLPLHRVTAPLADPIARTSPVPLVFEANGDRTDPAAQFLARGRGYTAFLTAEGPVLALRVPRTSPDGGNATTNGQPVGYGRAVLRMRFAGAAPDLRLEGEKALAGRVNSFLGSDPSKWRTDIPTFGSVRGRGAFPGVDVVYESRGTDLEYSFEVRPGADPGKIVFTFEGAYDVRVARDGALVVQTPGGEVRHGAPVAWQWQEVGGRREPVAAAFTEGEGGRISFEVGAFDRGRPLLIDPTLSYSTYLGGSADEEGRGIAVDGNGNAFVTGYTGSTTFPTVSAYDSTENGDWDVLVAKVGPAGDTLVYSTYLGGADSDLGYGITVDGIGNAFVTGQTYSTDFPTVSAYDSSANGAWDAFVAKLGPAGDTLVYGTYLGGGTHNDFGTGIAVDGSGSAFVTGYTLSTDFPTASAYDSTANGEFDAFVARIGPAGDTLVYGTYLGGADWDIGHGIAVDGSGNAFVTGYTLSTDFPTASAYDSSANGRSDAFIAKIGPAGDTLVYGTFLGGAEYEEGTGIAVDGDGNAFVTGFTLSTDFPTASAYDSSANGGIGVDAFVAKIGPAGNTLVYGTFLGGTDYEEGTGIAVDGNGNAFVTGFTFSQDFPTVSAHDSSGNGSFDAFVAKIGPTGNTLVYSTYLGGAGRDEGHGIAVDGSGNAFVTGSSQSTHFPTRSAYDSSANKLSDAFVAKITFAPLALSVTKGTLRDESVAGGDSFAARGPLYYDALAAGHEFAPETDGVEISFGAPGNPYVLTVPPGTAGWKHKEGKYSWRNARGTTPQVHLSLDPGKGKFSIRARSLEIPLVPTSQVILLLQSGTTVGTIEEAWSPNPKKPGLLKRR